MYRTRRILTVFLASPSDVAAERDVAREVVDEVNENVGKKLGWQIDLHRWEETAPGAGRPQDIINARMVDGCDLFIGLLWRRWGEPTGLFSSGFEEEFERAKKRRQEESKPEIWLFFKTVDSENLRDPGQHLAQVIKFRESQIALQQFLFKSVTTTEAWRTTLNQYLTAHIIDLHLAEQTERQPTSAVSVVRSDSVTEPASHAGENEKAIQQLRTVISAVSEFLDSGDPLFPRGQTDDVRELQVARLYLFSATMLSRGNTNEVLGTHEVNLLYKLRQQLELTSIERYQLLRAFAGDAGDLIPGWAWFQGLPTASVPRLLLVLGEQDSLPSVRAQALKVLRKAKLRIELDLRQRLPKDDESFEVREQVYELLASLGDSDALTTLEELASPREGFSGVEAHLPRFKLLAHLKPFEAFSETLANTEYVSDEETKILERVSPKLDEASLIKGLESSWGKLRELSLKELARRGRLSTITARALCQDDSTQIRAMAFEYLAKQGELIDFQDVRKSLSPTASETRESMPVLPMYGGFYGDTHPVQPDADSIIVSFYRTRKTEDLLHSVDWYSVDGPLAYKALALDRFEEISERLRADLADDFIKIKAQSDEKEKSKFGAEKWAKYAPQFEKYDNSTRTRFTEAALLGLAAHGQKSDSEIARRYIAHSASSVLEAVVAILAKWGNSGDVRFLLRIVKETWGDLRQVAATAALRLADNTSEVAWDLATSNDRKVAETGFAWICAQDSTEVRSLFDKMLRSQVDTDRIRAVYYFAKWMDAPKLTQLLESYVSSETYYYDVVTWLDRLIFSPEPLREMYQRELQVDASGLDGLET